MTVLAMVTVSACGHHSAESTSQDFGTIKTRFGLAHMQCGGELGPACGYATRLEFSECSVAINQYIDSGVRPRDSVKATDAATRALINNMAPPSGNTWMMGCPDGSLSLTNG